MCCDVFQGMGFSFVRNEMLLQSILVEDLFYHWLVDFIGPINPLEHYLGVRYIIMDTNYLT
jgi:hypothetical protein